MAGDPTAVLVAASFLHLGFQAVVTGVAYPALADVPIADWQRAHAAHSRRILPLVVVVYGALVVAGGLVLAAGPAPLEWVAGAAAVLAVVTTAVVAAPSHGHLARRRSGPTMRRLRVADRVRVASAAIGAVAALGAAIGG